MPSDYLVQAILPHDSGLPENVSVNTWSIKTTTTGDLTALQAAVDELKAFYLTMDIYLSSVNASTMLFKAYDRADLSPRVPVLEDDQALTLSTGSMIPQAALCLSFQGNRISGQSQARRRGRIYLGPLSSAAEGFDGRPAAALVTALSGAGGTLLAASDADPDWSWCVWSEVDQAGIVIDNGWVDNRFDIQRRRAEAATSRTVF